MPGSHRLQILLIEDNPGDAELTRQNLQESKVLHDLRVITRGEDALDWLRKGLEAPAARQPDLILLDLELPGIDGLTVLGELKKDPQLRMIPVVVLTASKADRDVFRSYDLHASAYVVKPVKLSGIGEMVRGIDHFWLSVVRFPPTQED